MSETVALKVTDGECQVRQFEVVERILCLITPLGSVTLKRPIPHSRSLDVQVQVQGWSWQFEIHGSANDIFFSSKTTNFQKC
jgi:hypothetical protein